jgi:hypothetical protein
MKTLMVLCLLISSTLYGYAQFTVDAGSDVKECHYYDTVRLGGHPSASGGKAPYVYGWKCRFYHTAGWYPIWDILKDPASPNPIINENCFYLNDTIEFYLTVTDSDQNILKDSVNVIFSTFMILTIENGVTINFGDSAQIISRWVGGISPFTYLWSPSAWLSDPLIEKPWAKPPVSTSYSVKVTDAIGCTANDNCWVEVRTTGIDRVGYSFGSIVHPDPITISSVITFNGQFTENLIIKVFSQDGRVVLSDRYYQDYRIGEKITTRGFFFYQIFDDNKPVTGGKIIRQ